jgi:hypothetical protein
MSRSFLVDSLIGNNSPPTYPLPYYSGQLPNYMFNFFNLGLGTYQHQQQQQLARPVPRQPSSLFTNIEQTQLSLPIQNVNVTTRVPTSKQSSPSPTQNLTNHVSGKDLFFFFNLILINVQDFL